MFKFIEINGFMTITSSNVDIVQLSPLKTTRPSQIKITPNQCFQNYNILSKWNILKINPFKTTTPSQIGKYWKLIFSRPQTLPSERCLKSGVTRPLYHPNVKIMWNLSFQGYHTDLKSSTMSNLCPLYLGWVACQLQTGFQEKLSYGLNGLHFPGDLNSDYADSSHVSLMNNLLQIISRKKPTVLTWPFCNTKIYIASELWSSTLIGQYTEWN